MQGFTLLEVLVSLLMVSIGLLGITGMQLFGLRHAGEAYEYAVATVQLESMLERLRANQTPEARSNELIRWNNINQRVLPNGKGDYECQQGICRVEVSWRHQTTQTLFLNANLS